jgi:hypothetical protein
VVTKGGFSRLAPGRLSGEPLPMLLNFTPAPEVVTDEMPSSDPSLK